MLFHFPSITFDTSDWISRAKACHSTLFRSDNSGAQSAPSISLMIPAKSHSPEQTLKLVNFDILVAIFVGNLEGGEIVSKILRSGRTVVGRLGKSDVLVLGSDLQPETM